MGKKIWGFLLVLFLFSFVTSGCSYFKAKDDIAAADGMLSELKAAGGQRLVPYEYTSAEKFLEISKMELNHYDYGAAITFAERSKAAAQAGITAVRKK